MTLPAVEEAIRVKRRAPPPEGPTIELKRDGKEIKFTRGDKIGRGAFGAVYKAMDKATGEIIAVKYIPTATLKEDQKKSIEREITTMAELDHPNVVRFIGSQRYPTHLVILMEFVAAKSLSDLLKEFKNLTEDTIRRYMTQLLQGLSYCHERKVIHRDIKGKNILVSNNQCKIADFGSARLVDDILTKDGLSASFGYTPLWLAPEVCTGKYNSKVDIWSLGCTMLEMASGKDPWYEHDFQESFQALYFIAKNDVLPKFPSHLSPVALDFLKACFTRDPEARPSAAQLLLHDFIVKGAPKTPSPRSLPPTTPVTPSRPLSPFSTASTVGSFSPRGPTPATTRKSDDSPKASSPSPKASPSPKMIPQTQGVPLLRTPA